MSQIIKQPKTKGSTKIQLPHVAECLTCGQLYTQDNMSLHLIQEHTFSEVCSGFIDGAFYLHPLLERFKVMREARQ